MTSTTTKKRVPFKWVAVGIAVVALLLAGVVSYYASAHPDGLMYVAGKTGFIDQETAHNGANGPLAGYGTKGVDNERLSGGLAGVIGTVVVLVVAGGLVLLVRRRPTDSSDEA
jgi:hypothetical protein